MELQVWPALNSDISMPVSGNNHRGEKTVGATQARIKVQSSGLNFNAKAWRGKAATKRPEALTQRSKGRRGPRRKLNSAKPCVFRASALENLRKKIKFSQIAAAQRHEDAT